MMMLNSEVIYCYGQLASTVSRMAALARARQWDQLPDLEARCACVVDQLKLIEPLNSFQREEVQHLVTRIRKDQEEVCRLVKPQLDRLMARMAHLPMQNNLGQAYNGLLQ